LSRPCHGLLSYCSFAVEVMTDLLAAAPRQATVICNLKPDVDLESW